MKRVALQKLGGSIWTYDTNILHLSGGLWELSYNVHFGMDCIWILINQIEIRMINKEYSISQ